MQYVISGSLGALLSAMGAYFIIQYASQFRLLDLPNERSSHTSETVRGIGLALALATAATATCMTVLGLLSATRLVICFAAVFMIGGVGFADDMGGVSVRKRLLVHVVAAACVVELIISMHVTLDPFRHVGALLLGALVLVWALNLFNFMDGIDGIALQQAIFMALAALVLLASSGSEWIAILVGIASGALVLLIWNWAPANAFLGDVGSGFLGFLLGAISIDTIIGGLISSECWIILWGVFLVDSTVTLATRVLTGQVWYRPHRLHAYQHLARIWRSHSRVSLAAIAVNLLWIFPWAFVAQSRLLPFGICGFLALLPLVLIALVTRAGLAETV